MKFIKKYEKLEPHIVIGTIGRIHDLVIESNVGKNPGSSVINYINIETLTNESAPVKDSGTKAPEITKAPLTKKVCPSCKNETNEGFCPKCGTKIE